MAMLQFENVCRLCLKQEDSMSSIFDVINEKDSELAGRITSIARVKVDPKDGLPSSICEMCRSQVEQFYEFRLLVEISDKTLRQYLKSGTADAEIQKKKKARRSKLVSCKPLAYALLMSANGDNEVWNPTLIENPLGSENDLIVVKTENLDNDSEPDFYDANPDQFCCELCSVQFSSLDDLKNHIIDHCSVTTASMKAKNVNSTKKTTDQENNRQKSNKTAKKSSEVLFACEGCNKTFSKLSLKRHSFRCPWRQKEFACDVCGKTFTKKSELRYHKGAHLPSPLICELCNKKFSNVQSYNIHMKRHTVGSRFACETCGKRYYTNSELARHVQKHADKRKHPCHLCDTAFLSRPELNRHLKYHNGVKPFKCHVCFKSYYESGHLKVHMRYHTGEKPFICHCGKAFVTKSKLIRHEKIHRKKHKTLNDDGF